MNANAYQPWLFDSETAWQQALQDPRWNYDLPISRFMQLYAEHRRGMVTHQTHATPQVIQSSPLPFSQASRPTAPPPQTASAGSSSGAGQILSQNEIDSLLSSLSH